MNNKERVIRKMQEMDYLYNFLLYSYDEIAAKYDEKRDTVEVYLIIYKNYQGKGFKGNKS